MTATTAEQEAPATAQAAPIGPRPGIPFSRLLRVEWRKSVDTRSARWLLGIVAVLTAGSMAIPLIWNSDIPQELPAYLAISQIGLVTLLPVVAIMTLTTEWTQRTVLTTFTQEPRRGRVVGAKVVTVSMLAIAATALAFAVSAAALALSAGLGRDVEWSIGADVAAGFTLYILLTVLMGAAFGAIFQSTALAIVLYFIVPFAWSLLTIVPALDEVGEWLDTSRTFQWLAEGEWDAHAGPIVVSTTVWVLVPLVLGVVRTLRREVK
ncbi:MAG: ABC transporter permease [Propionibacteriales bacterium]|nr:ABC transporter permease [Propionibacteriales bacterium]